MSSSRQPYQPYNSHPDSTDEIYSSLPPLSRTSSASPLLASEKSLFEQAIPEPSAPRAWLRTLATTVLLLFAIVVTWMAFAGTGRSDLGASAQGVGWVEFKSVPWGEATMGSYQSHSQEADHSQLTSEDASAATSFESADAPSGEAPDAQLAVIESSQGAFSAEKSAEVSALLASGAISDYVWHERLEGWSAATRLIFVGDLHGQVEPLTSVLVLPFPSARADLLPFRSSLLARLSYVPQSDTLIHVGDLVSKAPLNQSLETVRLMRTYGAKGVRGNHDQGVLEWRNWIASYGSLVLPATRSLSEDVGEEPQRFGQDGAGVWAGRYGDENVTQAQEGEVNKHVVKRGWFPWSSSSSEDAEAEAEEAEAEAEADAEFEYENEEATDGDALGEFAEAVSEEQGESSDSIAEVVDGEQSDSIEIAPLPGYEVDNVDASTTSSSSAFDSTDSTSTSSANDLTESHMFDESTSTFSSLQEGSSGGSEPFSGVSDGSFVGAGWEWLDTPVEDLAALGVVVPEGWNWGGDWFEIARNLPQVDADYLTALPLTLHIEELRTFVVHAGMRTFFFRFYTLQPSLTEVLRTVPWTSSAASIAASESTSPLPSLLTSSSTTTFVPTDTSLLSSPEQSLLLVSQNTEPFTLLNMRAVKQSRKYHETLVTNSRKGTPWHSVWNDGMEECEKTEGCEPVSLLYGHWAGRGLDIKKNSYVSPALPLSQSLTLAFHRFGLDSACSAGKRLSALVLSSSTESPLLSPATPLSAFRDLSAPSHPLADLTHAFSSPAPETLVAKEEARGLFQPWTPARGPKLRKRLLDEIKAVVLRKKEMQKGRLGKRGWWSSEPVVEDEVMTEELMEGGQGEMIEKAKGEEVSSDVVSTEEDEEDEDLDESDFEAQEVVLAGKGAWVISVACGSE